MRLGEGKLPPDKGSSRPQAYNRAQTEQEALRMYKVNMTSSHSVQHDTTEE